MKIKLPIKHELFDAKIKKSIEYERLPFYNPYRIRQITSLETGNLWIRKKYYQRRNDTVKLIKTVEGVASCQQSTFGHGYLNGGL